MTRTEIINNLIEINGYTKYLEIGVDNPDVNFYKIKCFDITGVDPNPKSKTTFIKTSDEFFNINKREFDLIFIDGLHHYEQVIKDIKNALHCLSPNGIIVVHDCNPTTEAMQAVPRAQGIWTGDVWRAWLYYRSNPELNMRVLDTDYGVGIIQKGKAEHVYNYNYEKMSYAEFNQIKKTALNLIPVEEDKLISICVPAFEQYSYGAHTLEQLFKSIQKQTYKNYEIIISDNANDDSIKKVCIKYSHLPIEYIRSNTRGTSHNMNLTMSKARGDLIKPMFQDDVFLSPDALKIIVFSLYFNKWVMSSGKSVDRNLNPYKNREPYFTQTILTKLNTIGMPSVIAHHKNEIKYDVKLKTRLDCDFYMSLYRLYGLPKLLKPKLIGSRYWHSSTSRKQRNFTAKETNYLLKKHKLK